MFRKAHVKVLTTTIIKMHMIFDIDFIAVARYFIQFLYIVKDNICVVTIIISWREFDFTENRIDE